MTLKRMRYLQELLAIFGLNGRLHLEWISSAEARKFVQVVKDFTENIRDLGPSPLSVFVEKIKAQEPKPAKKGCPINDLPKSDLVYAPFHRIKGL